MLSLYSLQPPPHLYTIVSQLSHPSQYIPKSVPSWHEAVTVTTVTIVATVATVTSVATVATVLRMIGWIHSRGRIHRRSALGRSKGSIGCNGSDGINSRNQSKCSNTSTGNSVTNSTWYLVGTITPNMKGVMAFIERRIWSRGSCRSTCDLV